MGLITIKSTEISLMWGIQMRKGQVTILLISVLIALTLGVMGFFAKNQVDDVELQQIGISFIATSIHIQQAPSIELPKSSNLFSKEK